MTTKSFRDGLLDRLPTFLLSGAVLLLLVLAVGLAWFVSQNAEDPGRATFNFIALVIIFMAALTLAASVFSGLKLANVNEAFGLPSGSVRALLAIGIMILFVVFGLPIVAPSGSGPARLQDRPFRTFQTDAMALPKTTQELRAQGLTVVVTDYGQPAVPAPPGQVAVPARPAQLEVFTTTTARPAEELDFSKQLLTAIITLLTSVISFYFGSRSATEGVREAVGDSGVGPSAPLDVEQKKLTERLNLLTSEIDKVNHAVDELKAAPQPTDPTVAARRSDALVRASAVRGEIEAQRDRARRRIDELGIKVASLAAGASADSQLNMDARDQAQSIAALIQGLEQAQAAYAELVGSIYLMR